MNKILLIEDDIALSKKSRETLTEKQLISKSSPCSRISYNPRSNS